MTNLASRRCGRANVKSHKFVDYTDLEIKSLIDAGCLAIVPTGCTEQQGLNRLEKLRGDRVGQYSIRINDQWRICFTWRNGDAYNVEIVDYH